MKTQVSDSGNGVFFVAGMVDRERGRCYDPVSAKRTRRGENVMSNPWSERMRLAQEIVTKGYRLARAIQKSGVEARLKVNEGDHPSTITKGDIVVEKMMVEVIRACFPEDSILGEEGEAGDKVPEGICWVLDPVDGTGNYSRSIEPWAVSAAVFENGLPVVSVVALEGSTFATNANIDYVLRDGKPMAVDLGRKTTKKPLISYECFEWFEDGTDLIEEIWDSGLGSRQLSSSIGQSLMVATGQLDGFLHPGIALWDHAGIVLLAEKAGLKVSRWDGTPSFPHVWERATRDLAAYRKHEYIFDLCIAVPGVYDQLMEIVSGHAGWTETHDRFKRV